MMSILITMIVILTLICVCGMGLQYRKQFKHEFSLKMKVKLISSGVIAFIADTIGIGSFAVGIALAKFLNTFDDEELPPMVNGAQIIPGALESLFFMQIIQVDIQTLVTLVLGTCIGGLLGGYIIPRLSKQAIRLLMLCCFTVIIFLILGNQLHLLPIGGDLTALHSWRLCFGFIGMILCGALTSAGIGLFAMVQGVLFLLNVSPAVAFPIMTTAGAMQQPITTLMFLKQGKIPLQKTFLVSLGGCVGVLLIVPIFPYLNAAYLHNLLIGILVFNLYRIGRAYFMDKRLEQVRIEDMSAV
jgi:uncharacterized membrane protein YfcA